jgi:pimeloyl-ACP methyl ester carboxylesterase
MPDWMYWVLGFVFGPMPIAGGFVLFCYLYYRWKALHIVVEIFQVKPLFIIPRGNPVEGAEDIRITTADGLSLHGCYLKTPVARRGVVMFGLEYGSNRWACVPYCERLLAAGYDVFACEIRNQGDSGKDATYEPLQWVTDRDLNDARAALKYLLSRPDADPAGVGYFGVSKGGSLGLLLAAEDRRVRCVATDGAYATYTTVVPHMRKFVGIYFKKRPAIRNMIPDWFYGLLGSDAMTHVAKLRKLEYVSVEKAVRKLRQPLFMVHGGGDTYITPEMAESLFKDAKRCRKELWVVPKAKHNQAITTAGDEYHARVVAFFDAHLGGPVRTPTTSSDPVIDVPASAEHAALVAQPK